MSTLAANNKHVDTCPFTFQTSLFMSQNKIKALIKSRYFSIFFF